MTTDSRSLVYLLLPDSARVRLPIVGEPLLTDALDLFAEEHGGEPEPVLVIGTDGEPARVLCAGHVGAVLNDYAAGVAKRHFLRPFVGDPCRRALSAVHAAAEEGSEAFAREIAAEWYEPDPDTRRRMGSMPERVADGVRAEALQEALKEETEDLATLLLRRLQSPVALAA